MSFQYVLVGTTLLYFGKFRALSFGPNKQAGKVFSEYIYSNVLNIGRNTFGYVIN